ncbi:hypothetical protein FSP39_006062 [Pinctada imbricata]|uniref:D-isomer specific 2-hydroxyacid dehydrogenase NAD-binding domain-containing protein n=1 Tax=Pinctada imbricata TaxID=66713 RepID=A0AA88YFN4_PINIB|nr:hypothetical protein FSP39_006062 [Pinctada imbricata]
MRERRRVYVTNHIPQEALDVLLRECNVGFWGSTEPVPRGELLNNVRGVDGIICMETDVIDRAVLDAAGPKLKVIGTLSCGKYNINEEECRTRGIQILTLPRDSMETIADVTVASMIEATNHMTDNQLPENNNDDNLNPDCNGSHCLFKRELRNASVGILGFGKKGKAVAKKFLDMGVQNVMYNEIQTISNSKNMNAKSVPFETLLKDSDVVCLCSKVSPESVHRFHLDAFKMMKPSAVLIDCSNGQVIDYEALYQALREKTISAAGLNILDANKNIPFRSPLSGLQNCLFFPFKECNKLWDKRSQYSATIARDLIQTLKATNHSPCPSR